MRPVYDEAEARWCETKTNRLANYRGHEAEIHENEATTHEAENEVEAIKFGLETDSTSVLIT